MNVVYSDGRSSPPPPAFHLQSGVCALIWLQLQSSVVRRLAPGQTPSICLHRALNLPPGLFASQASGSREPASEMSR